MATTQTTEDTKIKAPIYIDQASAKAVDTDRKRDDDDDGAPLDADIQFDNPRLDMMNKAREKRAKDFGLEVDATKNHDDRDTSLADFKGDDEDAEPTGDKKDEDDIPAHIVTLADTDIVTIKVNGEDVKLPWGEAQKRLQISQATEEVLEEAKAERAAARALRKQAEEEEGAAPTEKTAPAKADDKPDDMAAVKAAKDAAFDEWEKAVRYGTEEEIAEARKDLRAKEDALEVAREARLVSLAQANTKAGPDPFIEREQIASQRATEEYVEAFKEDQKDRLYRAAMAMTMRDELIADLRALAPLTDREDVGKMLSKLSDRELGAHHQQARSRGLVRTLDKVLTAAGNSARAELKGRTSPQQAKTPLSQRQEAKQSAPTSPNAATGRSPDAAPDDKPKTSKDIMAEVRKSRGK
jgi:hypothetical protein